MLQFLPVALLAPAVVVAVRTLIGKLRTRRDLARAVANGGEQAAVTLHGLIAADDLPGVVAHIRGHLADLPASERRLADEALLQPSEAGRRAYAHGIVAASLRQLTASP